MFRKIIKYLAILALVLGVIGLTIPFLDGKVSYSDFYGTVSSRIKDGAVIVQTSTQNVSSTSWPLVLVLMGIFLALVMWLTRRKSHPVRLSARRKLAALKIRRRHGGVIDRIAAFVSGIFSVAFNFLHFTLIILGNVFFLAAIYFVLANNPDALKDVGAAFAGAGLPQKFQGLGGGLTLFMIISAGIIIAVAMFVALAKSFTTLLAGHHSMRPQAAGYIISYLVYGVALTLTISVFSKFAAISCFVITFVLCPIVFGLISLIAEETKETPE